LIFLLFPVAYTVILLLKRKKSFPSQVFTGRSVSHALC